MVTISANCSHSFTLSILNLENNSSLHEAIFDLQVWTGFWGSAAQTFMWSSSVCQYVCVCVRRWPLTGAKSSLSVKPAKWIRTASEVWTVNCALSLVTLKPALSVGQLPGYIRTVRPSSSSQPAQRSNTAPELSLYWKQTKCAIKKCVWCFATWTPWDETHLICSADLLQQHFGWGSIFTFCEFRFGQCVGFIGVLKYIKK